MAEGTLVMQGHRGTPTANLMILPAAAGTFLRVKDWEKSVLVEEETPERACIYDVGVFSVSQVANASAEEIKVAQPSTTFAPAAPSGASGNGGKARRGQKAGGRKAAVRNRVKEEMRRDIVEGRYSLETLDNELEKILAWNYGASRSTCRKARKELLTEMPGDK
jgi:hypothetical protein